MNGLRDPGRRWKEFWLRALGGSAIGAVAAAGAIALITSGFMEFQDYLPMLMAAFYAVTGITVWVNPYVRRTKAPGERLWPRCLMMLTLAFAVAAPVIMPASVAPWNIFLLVVALYGIGWWIFRGIMRRSDELMKRVVVDTNQMTLYIALPVLLLYGAAERLNLVPGSVSMWVLNGILAHVYFVVTQFAWMRQGLANPLVAEE